MGQSYLALIFKHISHFSNQQWLGSPYIGCQNSYVGFFTHVAPTYSVITCYKWHSAARLLLSKPHCTTYSSLGLAMYLKPPESAFCAFIKWGNNSITLHSRNSQPQYYWHLGPDHSGGGGVAYALWDVWQHPWPLPTRCQKHPFTFYHFVTTKKVPRQTLPNIP